MMLITLKALHLLALMFGSASALGNLYLGFASGPHDLAAPAYTNTLRKIFRSTGLIAIILLWISGLVLFVAQYGGRVDGIAFHLKIAFVLLLSAYIFFINIMAPKWAKRGGPPSYIPALSWISAIALIVIVVLAVVTFS